MSDDGNNIKNRARMFENNKHVIGIMKSEVKPSVTRTYKSTLDHEEMEKQRPQKVATRPRIVAKPAEMLSNSVDTTSKKPPPVRRPPSTLTSHPKPAIIPQKPAVRIPPSPTSVNTKNNSDSDKAETDNTNKTKISATQDYQAPSLKHLSPVALPKVESSKGTPPSGHRSNESTLGASTESFPEPPKLYPNVKSPTSHPPPPAPPVVPSIHKNKTGNQSIDLPCPPPVPPPPPTVSKTASNVLVGWASSTTNKKETVEVVKPPPILVAPPSLQHFEEVKKTTKSNASSFPEDENGDAYDEDDDYINSTWYFDVSKSEATHLMRDCDNIGTFMVRPSDNNQFVLMVRAGPDVVKKFKIQQHKNGWVLGDLSDCKRIHTSISSLIEFYCANSVKVGNTNLKLKQPVPKD